MKELLKLYRDRLRDREQFRTKRRRLVESDLKPMESLIEGFFHKDPEALRKIQETRALQAWVDYVGEAVARVASAERIRGTQLIVRVKDGLWMQQLLLRKNDLLRKFRADFPALKLSDIFFTLAKSQ